jgi:peptide/nickel transport system ATP-binding protein
MSAQRPGDASPPVLEVRDLDVSIHGEAASFLVVRNMAFAVRPGETLAIVGESGCGKSMTALSLMRLEPAAAAIERGAILLEGADLRELPQAELEDLRGNRISMIFQEPLTSLNPVMTIGDQIAEGVMQHRRVSRRTARRRAIETLNLVRMPDPERRADQYPHQLSGGMRQRAMIAVALACDPRVLVADEPTTALDVTIQAQILGLIRDLQQRLGTALVLITHDLGVVAEMADQVIVMYAGRRVEVAPVGALFDRPIHPYTRALMKAAPHLTDVGYAKTRLAEIPGTVPPPWDMPRGCAFAPRCPTAVDRCFHEEPPLALKEDGHWAACWENGHDAREVLDSFVRDEDSRARGEAPTPAGRPI